MKQRTKVKTNKGITLIALVITVIVLLILAGVAIATLTGDNGILNQAESAKEKTQEAEAIERVALEVQGSYGTDGKIDMDMLNDNLKNNVPGLTYNDKPITEKGAAEENRIGSLPATVTLNGYDILIDANGGVSKKETGIVEEIAANPKAYYGKKVTNYKDDGNTYRIFYIDTENYFGDGENTIYLKADFSSSTYNLSNYESYDETNTKVREMNPLWAEQRGSNESNWKNNEKAAAYLCSPVNADNYTSTTSLPWNGYYNLENANYVIGGPSVEMYVKSYNQAYDGIITENTKYPIGAVYRATSVPGYIYTLNGAQSTISNSDYWTGNDSLDYTRYNSMYCGKAGSKTGVWWLASPSAYYSNYVCSVGGNYAYLRYYDYSYSLAVAPLVSLRSNFIPQVEE